MAIVLVSNYHGCKEETINTTLFDRYFSTIKPSHLKKITNHAKVK